MCLDFHGTLQSSRWSLKASLKPLVVAKDMGSDGESVKFHLDAKASLFKHLGLM